MVGKSRRKELLEQYAERKPSVGVYAVKCAATGETWVAWSKSLDKRQNGLWFELRAGGGGVGVVDLLPAWEAHGEASFSYEILEQINEDNPHKLELLLKDRTAHWLEKLGAKAIPNR